jgi:transcriptional repressor NF-X1
MTTAEPYNAFLLSNPRFGLTIDELHAELDPVASNFKLDVSFLVSGEVIVKATASASGSWIHKTSLSTLKTAISKKVTDHGLGSSCILCSVDSNRK